jgi:osmotically-inducible protein OsmY
MTQTLRRTDAELKTAIVDELSWTAGIDSTNIGVAVTSGAVTLSGEVGSYPEKIIAEKAASAVRGLTAFADEITVRGSWTGVNDTDIAREASEALHRSVAVPAGMVTAAVHDHTITLSGQVPWHFQREAAARAVRYLHGVGNVVNAIAIKPTVSSTGIKTAISAALVRRAQSEASQTTVSADPTGAVTLDGTVHSWTERRDAEQAAWSAPGVTDVTNRLRVKN